MGTVTTSFISEIIDSLFAAIDANCGIGNSKWPDPAYLQVRTLERPGGFASLDVSVDNMPAVWISSLSGQKAKGVIGDQYGWRDELFNVFGILSLTPAEMEMTDLTDVSAFRAYAEASSDTLMRRIWRTIEEWSANISCNLTGGSTNGATVDGWASIPDAQGELEIIYRIFLAVRVRVD